MDVASLQNQLIAIKWWDYMKECYIVIEVIYHEDECRDEAPQK